MNKFLYIIPLVAVLLLSGCNRSNKQETAKSSVAQLTGFAFAKDDSIPGLAEAVFTVEERLDTGLVWNKDSIRFGTSLEKVVPRFVFAATPGAASLSLPDTTCVLTGYDTLDFSKQPIYLTIRSADGTTTKTYAICPTVHQVDPELYTWEMLTEAIYPADESEQRVLLLGDRFVMIKSNGFALHTYASDDAVTWSDLGEPAGLPGSTKVRQIISDTTTLYYAEGTTLYTSDDGVNWTTQATSLLVYTMLLFWNEQVWALVDNGEPELAIWTGSEMQPMGLRPDGDFPISDFGTVCFQSASLRQRAMIIGGFAENGKSLNTRWNLEYAPHSSAPNGYRMQEFSIDRPAFTSLSGISAVWYNGRLMLFGGVNDQMTYFGRNILYSVDEGLNWLTADTTKNQLPETYQARQKQTAIVRNGYIYLFGGQDQTVTYSDVYRGRLNSIDW